MLPDPRLLAMAFVARSREPRCESRGRESADVGTGRRTAWTSGTWQVTHAVSGASRCAARMPWQSRQLPHDGRAHLHGIASGLAMARAAPERGIGRRPPDLLGVARVGELQVAGARGRRRRPLHPILDRAVVAVGAVRRLRPERGGGLGGAGVASDAGGEELAMLPVVEAVLRHPCQGGAAGERADDEEQGPRRDAEPHRPPARGRVRSAGGSGTTSVSLRRSRVTRACSLVWSQSKAAASGRSRDSQYRAPPIARRS